MTGEVTHEPGTPDDDAAAQQSAATGLLHSLRTITLRTVVLAVTGVVVLVSGLFGGLRSVEEPEVPTAALEEKVHVAPFDLTLKRARWVSDLGAGFASPEGRYVAVVATLTNTSDHPVFASEIAATVSVADLPGTHDAYGNPVADGEVAEPRIVVLADGLDLSQAQPDLSYEVAFLWDQSLDEEVPTSLDLTLRSHTWRTSSLEDQMIWTDAAVSHTATLDVEDDPEATK